MSKSRKIKAPLGSARAAKHILAGICTAVFVIAAAQGNAQPTSNTAEWLEEEAKTTSSGMAAGAAKDIDKHIVPSDSGSGSFLDTILEFLGFTTSSDPATQKSGGTAEEHMERVDDRRAADASLSVVGPGTSKGVGGPMPESARDLLQPGPMVARRQEAQDEKLASETHGPWSWVPQFWRDFWTTDELPDDSTGFYLSELDIYAIIVLAGLGVLGLLALRRKAA